jgi:hypothetical protein
MEKEKNINFGKLCIRYFYNRVRSFYLPTIFYKRTSFQFRNSLCARVCVCLCE